MFDMGYIILLVAYFISLYFVVFWLLVFIDKEEYKKIILTKYPSVSVIVPAYNEEDAIVDTLKSVVKLDYPKDKLNVFVVNDGSTDRTKILVEDFIKKNKDFSIKLINQANKGKGAAVNNALKSVNTEYFATLDADSFVKSDALKKLLPYFYDSNVCCVIPMMKVKNPKNLLLRAQWYEYLVNLFYKRLNSRLDAVNVIPGPFPLFRTKLVKSAGGFTEDRKNRTEDFELTLKLQSRNYKIVQSFDTEVYTIAPQTYKEWIGQRDRWYGGTLYNVKKYKKMLFNKQYGDFGVVMLPMLIIAGILSVVILAVLLQKWVNSIITAFNNFAAVNFDFITLLSNFRFDFNILDLDYINLSIAFFVILISAFVIVKAHKWADEKLNKNGKALISLLYFLFVYSFLLAAVWFKVFFDSIVGRKIRW